MADAQTWSIFIFCFSPNLRCWDIFHDCFEYRLDIFHAIKIRDKACFTLDTRCVDNRKLNLLFARTQFKK